MDALTLLSYGLVGYLIAPVAVLVSASLHKETYHGHSLKGLLWFSVAMVTLCVVVILFIGPQRATALHNSRERLEIHHQAR